MKSKNGLRWITGILVALVVGLLIAGGVTSTILFFTARSELNQVQAVNADYWAQNQDLKAAIDDNLLKLQEARKAGDDKGKYEFYRGVYASCLTILVKELKTNPGPTMEFCRNFTVDAQKVGAYGMEYPTPPNSTMPLKNL
jgi:hypothetical protein